MKKRLLTGVLCFSAMIACNKQVAAQTLIHYWHFNNYTGTMNTYPTNGMMPIDADYSVIDTTKATVYYQEMSGTSAAYNTYCDPVALDGAAGPIDYDTINAQFGEAAGNGFRTRNPSDSMYLYFYLPSTGFRNVVLTYATEPSSITSGMLEQLFDYSTDSGTTWKNTLLSIPSYSFTTPTPDSFMQRVTVTFTSDSAANNNPKLVFRIHWNLPNDTSGHIPATAGAGKGNNRFDNITLTGTAISPAGVSQITRNSNNYIVYPNPVADQMLVNSEFEGTKSIVISNIAGQTVYLGMANGKNFSVNTSSLTAGNYYINIRENTTGEVSAIKFVKQ